VGRKKKEEIEKDLSAIRENAGGEKKDIPPSVQDTPKRKRRSKEQILQDKRKAELDRLPKDPNPLIVPVINGIFDHWAGAVKVEDLKLKEGEAESLALPITQLIAYYLPQMPPIALAWGSLGAAAYGIMGPRLTLLSEMRKKKEKNKVKPPVKPGAAKAPKLDGKNTTDFKPTVIDT